MGNEPDVGIRSGLGQGIKDGLEIQVYGTKVRRRGYSGANVTQILDMGLTSVLLLTAPKVRPSSPIEVKANGKKRSASAI